jgi:hypothetical protein
MTVGSDWQSLPSGEWRRQPDGSWIRTTTRTSGAGTVVSTTETVDLTGYTQYVIQATQPDLVDGLEWVVVAASSAGYGYGAYGSGPYGQGSDGEYNPPTGSSTYGSSPYGSSPYGGS